MIVAAAEFDPMHLATRVIERGKNDRRPELALVDQTGRLFVIGVHTHPQPGQDDLLRADIVIIVPLGLHPAVLRDVGGGRGVGKRADGRRQH